MRDSEEEIFLTQSGFVGCLEPSTTINFLYQSSNESHCKPLFDTLFESDVAGETNFSFEGHYTMTNTDDANEVQENVETVKKRKKQGIEAMTDEEVAQRNTERISVNTRKATSWTVSRIRYPF